MNGLWAVDAEGLHLALVILAKLGIGAVLAGLIGWERERGGRAAGIRTHMLIIFGVILFTEVSKSFGGTEQSRVAAQILTGIGFLGAGTILRVGPEIKGLTTAASIWAVSAIGMAVSIGGAFMIVAVLATALTLITLALISRVEQRLFPNAHAKQLLLALREKTDVVSVLQVLNDAGMRINQTQILKTDPNVELLLRVGGDQDAILRTACSLPGVLSATWST
ncbi:MAG TPA: MgtC/SapB family protein [Fimbriimonadaceae bacterium]|nr:MgtC/SapB family protein [Fimbriimonadaceae bacterium]